MTSDLLCSNLQSFEILSTWIPCPLSFPFLDQSIWYWQRNGQLCRCYLLDLQQGGSREAGSIVVPAEDITSQKRIHCLMPEVHLSTYLEQIQKLSCSESWTAHHGSLQVQSVMYCLNCNLISPFFPSRPNTILRLRFNHFATECSWDHLYVYDGDSIYAPLLAAFR